MNFQVEGGPKLKRAAIQSLPEHQAGEIDKVEHDSNCDDKSTDEKPSAFYKTSQRINFGENWKRLTTLTGARTLKYV